MLGFIGAGAMAEALLSGILGNGLVLSASVGIRYRFQSGVVSSRDIRGATCSRQCRCASEM